MGRNKEEKRRDGVGGRRKGGIGENSEEGEKTRGLVDAVSGDG